MAHVDWVVAPSSDRRVDVFVLHQLLLEVVQLTLGDQLQLQCGEANGMLDESE